MDTVTSDPELASEMLALMNKELKATRLRIKELESNPDGVDVAAYIQRAQVAEESLEALKANLVDANSEKELLRTALEDLTDSKRCIKKEVPDKDPQVANFKETTDKAVSATDQSNSDTEGHIKDLESTLEKYRAKYKEEKRERKKLQTTCKALEDQLAHLAEEGGVKGVKLIRRGLEEEVFRLQAENKELKSQVTNERSSIAPSSSVDGQTTSTALPMILSRKDVDEYMQKLREFNDRPRNHVLQPIYHTGGDLKNYLAADKRTSSCSANFLLLPGLLEWCAEVHHAFAIGPIHIFDAITRRWTHKSIFETLYNKTFSLFYRWGSSGTYYAGTYKAIKLVDLCPNGFEGGIIFSKNVPLAAIADATIPSNSSDKNNDRPLPPISAIRRLYLDGVLKVEPLGLQCVGFDHALYTALKERYKENPPIGFSEVAYYPENTEQDRPKKKQRMG